MNGNCLFALLAIWCLLCADNVLAKQPARRGLSEQEIAKALDTLAERSMFSSYAYSFIAFPKDLDLRTMYATTQPKETGAPVNVTPYPLAKKATITLIWPEDIKNLKSGDHKTLHNMCVRLNGVANGVVPIKAAEVFSAGFAYGFVTRIIVGQYMKTGKQRGRNTPALGDLNFVANDLPALPNEAFTTLKEYQYDGTRDGITGVFDENMPRLLRQYNLQAAGMMQGWRAAGELEVGAYTYREEEKYLKAAWRLANSRFTPEQMGEATSYTLNYLLGYIIVARLRQ